MIQSTDKSKNEISVPVGHVRTQRELARLFGLECPSSISQYVNRGMPIEPDGTYNIKICLDWRQKNIQAASNVDDQYKFFRAANEKEKYLLAILKRESAEGELVPSSEVETRIAILLRPSIVAAQELDSLLDLDRPLDPIEAAALALVSQIFSVTNQLTITDSDS